MAISTLQNFYKETVAVACTTGATNIYVTTKPTPTNGYLVISAGTESLREIVKYTGIGTDGTGDYVTIALAGDRGLGGTTNQTHAVRETVRMNYTAQHQTEIDDAINAIVAGGAVDASTTNKGISKLSVAPASATEPIAIGDNDPRVGTQSNLVTTDEKAFLSTVTGMLFMYGAATAPTGFLLCNGAAVSRTTYADLFAVTSTSYGVGDGSTTFNVPDLRSSFPVGYGQKTKAFTFLDAAVNVSTNVITVTSNKFLYTGQAVVLSTSGVLPAGLSATTYYIIYVSDTTIKLATSRANADDGTAVDITAAAGGGTHTLTLTLTSRALADEGGEESHTIQTEELASHTHPLYDYSIGSDTVITGDGSGAYSSGQNTAATGGDTPHNTMPPFVTVNYIIKT
jgi:microcystin-dependent protein